MAEAAQQQLVDIDPDFEPLSRPRSCTWPLPRPEFINPANSNTSSPAPSVKQEPSGNVDFINNLSLLEETEDYPEQKPLVLCNDFQCQESCIHQQSQQHQQQQQQQQHPSPQLPHQQQVPLLSSPVGSASSVAAAAAAQRKSSSSRRNAWGNMSYADLITKAIESSPEKRLTLSQIYDWMVKSVPYFKDKGDSNSSAAVNICCVSNVERRTDSHNSRPAVDYTRNVSKLAKRCRAYSESPVLISCVVSPVVPSKQLVPSKQAIRCVSRLDGCRPPHGRDARVGAHSEAADLNGRCGFSGQILLPRFGALEQSAAAPRGIELTDGTSTREREPRAWEPSGTVERFPRPPVLEPPAPESLLAYSDTSSSRNDGPPPLRPPLRPPPPPVIPIQPDKFSAASSCRLPSPLPGADSPAGLGVKATFTRCARQALCKRSLRVERRALCCQLAAHRGQSEGHGIEPNPRLGSVGATGAWTIVGVDHVRDQVEDLAGVGLWPCHHDEPWCTSSRAAGEQRCLLRPLAPESHKSREVGAAEREPSFQGARSGTDIGASLLIHATPYPVVAEWTRMGLTRVNADLHSPPVSTPLPRRKGGPRPSRLGTMHTLSELINLDLLGSGTAGHLNSRDRKVTVEVLPVRRGSRAPTPPRARTHRLSPLCGPRLARTLPVSNVRISACPPTFSSLGGGPRISGITISTSQDFLRRYNGEGSLLIAVRSARVYVKETEQLRAALTLGEAAPVPVQALTIFRLDYCNSPLAGAPTSARIRVKTLVLAYRAVNGTAPPYLMVMVKPYTPAWFCEALGPGPQDPRPYERAHCVFGCRQADHMTPQYWWRTDSEEGEGEAGNYGGDVRAQHSKRAPLPPCSETEHSPFCLPRSLCGSGSLPSAYLGTPLVTFDLRGLYVSASARQELRGGAAVGAGTGRSTRRAEREKAWSGLALQPCGQHSMTPYPPAPHSEPRFLPDRNAAGAPFWNAAPPDPSGFRIIYVNKEEQRSQHRSLWDTTAHSTEGAGWWTPVPLSRDHARVGPAGKGRAELSAGWGPDVGNWSPTPSCTSPALVRRVVVRPRGRGKGSRQELKNSIRHNLSLHSRFIRVQNEGTGKSSWWMLNPEGGKSGKSPRRRAASMDNNSKFTKSRGRAAKKKVSLQGGPEGGADSPGSQYTKWPGSPNSHSNDDFDAWNSFRPRTSSNASTLSGRLSPFMPEQDDLVDGDVHLVYPGASGAKMTATLPSLSEMTGSLGHHSSENVMEDLLDNLNLLSPKNPQVGGAGGGSSQSSPSAMMQTSPGYPPYSSPGMGSQPQPDYRKCLYGQAGLNAMPPIPMQTLAEGNPGFSPSSLGQYRQGLLKELLTSDTDPHGDLMPSVETVVSQSAGGHMLPPYSGQPGRGGKMPHPHHHPHAAVVRGPPPPTSGVMNGRPLLPPTGMTHSGARLATVKTPIFGPPLHLPGGVLPSYCTLNSNGYGRPGLTPQHHLEKLPSDLDDVAIQGFECDMESILHDTLMDGESLDFSYDPMGNPQGFPHSVKTTTHSWVSGVFCGGTVVQWIALSPHSKKTETLTPRWRQVCHASLPGSRPPPVRGLLRENK
ncbi:hypothetical protein AAFF_G00089190 [Aldrovandia affinis]|uniref:Fork-head domain-containing protein n=1 Tax=Aldrovandia affinis TaxID=143900 RepID=A0AAD7RWB6_9TELE|nr:hypothetical protein AAFF_G00089190 [Aldrovandia affinis]